MFIFPGDVTFLFEDAITREYALAIADEMGLPLTKIKNVKTKRGTLPRKMLFRVRDDSEQARAMKFTSKVFGLIGFSTVPLALHMSDIPIKPMRWDSKEAQYCIEPWQKRGLMLSTGDGLVVWKYVSPELVGNMKYPYKIGEPFKNDGMVCAGPYGTLNHYNIHKDDSHMIAIVATKIAVVSIGNGIFRALEGVPVVHYRASNMSEEGVDLERIEGEENAAIRAILSGGDAANTK